MFFISKTYLLNHEKDKCIDENGRAKHEQWEAFQQNNDQEPGQQSKSNLQCNLLNFGYFKELHKCLIT